MNKQEVYDFLTSRGIEYEVTEHGAVTPLGILNDSEKKVKFFLDEELVNGGLIGVHSNDNTATVWLKTTDLIDIITEHGNEVEAVTI